MVRSFRYAMLELGALGTLGAIGAVGALLSSCAASPPRANEAYATVQMNVNFTSGASGGVPKKVARGAMSGAPQRVGFFYSVNPDCSSDGLVQTQLKASPTHGTVTFAKADGYTNFPASSPGHDCNSKRSPGIEIIYTSTQGFAGTDQFTVQGVGPHGAYLETDYTVTVIVPSS